MRSARAWTGVPRIANAAVTLALTRALAAWTWTLASPPPEPAPPSSPSARAPDLGLAARRAAEIFGAAAPRPEQAPPSSLNLRLAGLVRSDSGGIAFISVDGKPQRAFEVGEKVADGVTLRSVLADRALIQRGGSVESLLLPGAAAEAAAGGAKGVRPAGDGTIVVSRRRVEAELASADLLDQVKLAPGADGLTVTEVKPQSLLGELGLRAGQTLRSVNGRPVRSLQDLLGLPGLLAGRDSVDVEVVLGGQTQRLRYRLE